MRDLTWFDPGSTEARFLAQARELDAETLLSRVRIAQKGKAVDVDLPPLRRAWEKAETIYLGELMRRARAGELK